MNADFGTALEQALRGALVHVGAGLAVVAVLMLVVLYLGARRS